MRLLECVAEVLSPTRCAGCELPGTLLCPVCAARLPRIGPATACARCGAPEGRARCAECAGREYAFVSATCLGTLEQPLSRMVVLLKDGGERRLGPLLGALTAEALPCDMDARAGPPDAVTWVPASRTALRRRGFDHAEAIAREVACVRRLPLARLLLRRGAADQRSLGREERAAAVASAFVAAGDGAPARVLLVDDVFTTGATLDACARVLLEHGAHDVRVLAVCRACGSPGIERATLPVLPSGSVVAGA